MKNPIVTICTDHGQIRIELYPEQAPNGVRGFIHLANRGLFDHRQIRRIAPGFVLQPSYTDFDDPRCSLELAGEFSANGFPNNLPFGRGTVALGGDETTCSPGSFFFTLTDEAGQRLAGKFTAIGQVISGWEEVERIAAVPTRRVILPEAPEVVIYEPLEPEHLVTVRVETFGEDYPEPEVPPAKTGSFDDNSGVK